MSERQLRTPLRLRRAADQPPRRDPAAARSWRRPAGSSTSRPTRSSCSSSCSHGLQETLDFLEPHCAFFTFAENWGRPDCGLPRQRALPLPADPPAGGPRPLARSLAAAGRRLHDDRQLAPGVARRHLRGRALHLEQAPRVPQVPRPAARAPGRRFELALSSCEPAEREMLAEHGWRVRDGLEVSTRDRPLPRLHRRLARRVHRRQGPERAPAHRLVQRPQRHLPRLGPAGGHPGHRLRQRPADRRGPASPSTRPTRRPTAVGGDRRRLRAPRRARPASSPASTSATRWCWGRCSSTSASPARRPRADGARPPVFPAEMALEPVSRRPTVLPRATVEAAQAQRRPPRHEDAPALGPESASIVVVTHDSLIFTRLCLESVLANTAGSDFELIVVDNGSSDGTPAYLTRLAERDARVRVLLNGRNMGFAPACNQGLGLAGGEHLVLLNNDTMVPPGWLGAPAGAPAQSRRRPGRPGHQPDRQRGRDRDRLPDLGRVPRASPRRRAERARRRVARDADAGDVLPGDAAPDLPAASARSTSATRSACSRTTTTPSARAAAGYQLRCVEDVARPPLRRGLLRQARRRRRVRADPARQPAALRGEVGPRLGALRPPPQPTLRARGRAAARGGEGGGAERRRRCWWSAAATRRCCELNGRRADALPAGRRTAAGPATIRPTARRRSATSRRCASGGAEYLVVPPTYRWWLSHYEGLRAASRRALRGGRLRRAAGRDLPPRGGWSDERARSRSSCRSTIAPRLTRRCLDAVLADLPAGCEVIVVDDASTDSTAELLAGYGDAIRGRCGWRSNAGYAARLQRGRRGGRAASALRLPQQRHRAAAGLAGGAGRLRRGPSRRRGGRRQAALPDRHRPARRRRHRPGRLPAQPLRRASRPSIRRSTTRGGCRRSPAPACWSAARPSSGPAASTRASSTRSRTSTSACGSARPGGEVHYCHEAVVTHLESASRGREDRFAQQRRALPRALARAGAPRRPRDLRRRRPARGRVRRGLSAAADGLPASGGGRRRPRGRGRAPARGLRAPGLRPARRGRPPDRRGRQRDWGSRRLSAAGEDSALGATPSSTTRDFLARGEPPRGTRCASCSSASSEPRSSRRTARDRSRQAAASATGSWSSGFAPRSPRRSRTGRSVLVVSRGDRDLVELDGRDARHFPQDERGRLPRPPSARQRGRGRAARVAAQPPAPSTSCCPRPPTGGSTTTPASRSTCEAATPRTERGCLHDLQPRRRSRRQAGPGGGPMSGNGSRPARRGRVRGPGRPRALDRRRLACRRARRCWWSARATRRCSTMPGLSSRSLSPGPGAASTRATIRSTAPPRSPSSRSCAAHGAEYLVIPATARWWLDFYEGFAAHLANHGELVADLPDACLIYGLGRLGDDAAGLPAVTKPTASVDQLRDYLENLISTESSVVVLEAGEGAVAALAPLRAVPLALDQVGAEGDEGLLRQLRHRAEAGADYLVVPRAADEWLDGPRRAQPPSSKQRAARSPTSGTSAGSSN